MATVPKTGEANVPKDGYIDPTQATDSKPWVPPFLRKFGVKVSDWLYALKTDLRVFMRPGYDLRVRVYACLLEFTRGYRSELAMKQVSREDKDDKRAKFVPVTPSMIIDKLWKVAKTEYRASGQPLSDDEAKKLRVKNRHIRRLLESMQREDGTVTAVTATKLLSRDPATRKLGWADVDRLMTERLSFDEALKAKLITPIEALSKQDRKRLAGISFLYVHVRPRPATMAALRRRTEEDLQLSKSSKQIHVELSDAIQLTLKFIRALGVDEPHLAAQISEQPAMQTYVQKLLEAEVSINNARSRLHDIQAQVKEFLGPIIVAYKQGTPLPQPAPLAVQAPLFPVALVPQPAPLSAAVPPAGTKTSPSGSPSGTAADPSLVSQPRKPQTIEELASVDAAMRTVCDPDSKAVKQLFGLCRDEAPDCTPAEVAIFVHRKIAVKQGKPVSNWIGYLHTAVPRCFEAPGFAKWRVEQLAFDVVEAENIERQRARARHILAATNEAYDDVDRGWAERILATEVA